MSTVRFATGLIKIIIHNDPELKQVIKNALSTLSPIPDSSGLYPGSYGKKKMGTSKINSDLYPDELTRN